MNDLLLWSLLLLTVTTVLLVLPFYPAWSEWRRPRDRQAQAVDPPAALDTGPRALQLAPGACFNTVHARHLMLGSGAMPAPSALRPWHEEQPRAKISLPSAINVALSDEAVATFSEAACATVYPKPTINNPARSNKGPANLWRRYFEMNLIYCTK